MSGLFGRVVNVDDGYVGTLNVGAIVFTASDSNPIPGNAFGIYRNHNDSFAISDPTAGSSTIIIENTLNLALDSYVDDQTFQENKTAQGEINDSILAALDGYGGSSGVSEDTFQENKNAQNQINQSILQALDGYAANVTVSEHYSQFSQAIQDITSTIDGYSTDIEFSGLTNTVEEHKAAQSQINQFILQSLDGYGGSSGVSETTFQENKTAQEEINDTILSSLDGYAAVQGTATQLAYFSGTNTLTSDTNLSFDTTNNRLITYSVQVTGDPGDGYILTSDANGVGSWQRAPIAFPSNRVFTVDATHPQADFTTIQDAITHASDGYMIIVSPGSYNEQLTLRAGISIEIIGSSNNAAAYVDVNWRFSTDGYLITAPDAGAGTTVFKNMRFSLTYDGLNKSTAILQMPGPSYGITCEDCTFSAITQGASGGKMMGALVYGGQLELINCELSADDNDSIFDVDTIRIGSGSIVLKNTTTFGFNNADIRIDGGQASLTIESSTVIGTIVVGNVQNIFLDRVSRIGAITGNVSDIDTETKLTSRVYGVGLTNGQNDFYKLNLREIGQVDIGSPNDGDIWYSRAAGRFRMKEGSIIKDMVPYSTLDGYGSVGQAPSFTGADGYIAFFTGNNQIAGDNDLFYDRVNNRLGINIVPSYPLHIQGDGGEDALRVVNDFDGYAAHFFNDGDSPNRVGIAIQCGTDNPIGQNPNQIFIVCLEGDGSITGQISASNAGVVSLIDVSDERKKKNITTSKVNALDIINRIELIEYNRYKGKKLYHKVDCGLGAQSLKKALPDAVQTMPDGSLGVSRTELIPVLTKAVQEQQELIKSQQKQIDELKELVNKLLSMK